MSEIIKNNKVLILRADTQTYTSINYPNWWDKTITLYNKYENPTTQLVKWYKHIIPNCFIKTTSSMISGGQITYNTNNNIIRIPQNDAFKSYDEWVSIPNTEQNEYFTIHQGDIIVTKEVEDIIEEYTSGLRSTDLISKYKDLGLCLTIDAWQDNTGKGRVSPHYFVSGE